MKKIKTVVILIALMISAGGMYFSTMTAAQPSPPTGASTEAATFTGSEACAECHDEIYERWRNTLMANVVTDPATHPEVVVGDFSTPNPLVNFSIGDVDLVYGSKWKQRYFTRIGNDFFVQPAQWDVQNRQWRRYHVNPGGDWWVDYYPDDQKQRPTGPLCDGCHSTNYNIETHEVTEWNVGCEKCHGPGSAHVADPTALNIVDPARLNPVAAVDICLQCHSQGQPLEKPLDGVYYDWPVGYLPGHKLSDYWMLEEHHLGEESFTHFPEGSAHKNRMQGNDFVTSAMYKKGVTCWSCHDVHGTANNADLLKPVRGNALCTSCHNMQSPNGPSGTLEEHTHHAASSSGSECVNCHMPRIARTVANINVRSHTFKFITPSMTEQYGIPNPCTLCHDDKTTQWAKEQLLSWSNLSPWRVGQ